MIEQCWSNDPKDCPSFSELYSKLSLNNGDFFVASDDNICESIIKSENDDDNDNETDKISKSYCFDEVDINEFLIFIDEIDEVDEGTKSIDENEIELLKNEINEIKNINIKLIKEN